MFCASVIAITFKDYEEEHIDDEGSEGNRTVGSGTGAGGNASSEQDYAYGAAATAPRTMNVGGGVARGENTPLLYQSEERL